MSIWQAILLGLIQGLTEFIPISSTAHLTIAGNMMGLINADKPEEWTAFIAVIQLGTLLAVIAYFWSDIIKIIRRIRFGKPRVDHKAYRLTTQRKATTASDG